jgi:hypothetical protein
MSLGGVDTSDDDLLQKVLSRLVDRDVDVVIAAGNDGEAGVSARSTFNDLRVAF